MWHPRSPDLNPRNFSLWGHLEHQVGCDNPSMLPDLQDSISRHVLSISKNTLRSTVEHTISRLQMIAENDGRHVEHVLM
ncbi:hypothetical protein AVEN_117226-1 [Araneus ventricosus]|uniref:Uncharacterized protein n=1 Tax=Araneus ventricosus TaxID=182803 RepID=A0A4Y2AZH5_ARAVE|nr:hypothetical protein AVEN_117226-1 [Araneus ventricosus]